MRSFAFDYFHGDGSQKKQKTLNETKRNETKQNEIMRTKTQNETKLKFGKGNAKLGKEIATFSLPSGFTCPNAKDCLSRANRETGKIVDGKETLFRCFSASAESVFPNVRKQRWHNFDLLKACAGDVVKMVELITASLPKLDIHRLHVAGDFFSQAYFDAWCQVARLNPTKTFYAYTKSLRFWAARLGNIPANLKLNASKGGLDDQLIELHSLKFAEVVFTISEAMEKGLEIDHDDSHAFAQDRSFALLLHGTQPRGSKAGHALRELKALGLGSYSKK